MADSDKVEGEAPPAAEAAAEAPPAEEAPAPAPAAPEDDEDRGPAPPPDQTLPDGSTMPALADGDYDVIVLGTGLKECIISGLLSVDKLRVLHMDRNNYYGGESASLQLGQMFEKFLGTSETPPNLGSGRDYNIDLIPKYIMATGKLVKMLIHTDVTKYLEFKSVEGSYVFKDGKVHKVPATDMEAAKTSLVGFFEKKRLRKFFIYVQDYDAANPKTHNSMDLNTMPAGKFCESFGLDVGTVDFLGHAMALQSDDSYLQRPAIEFVTAVKLYAESLARYSKSPYIYPLYGLGELPQAFARLSAVYGGTYMLNKPVDEIVYNAEGQACGVKSEGQYAKCKFIVGDPTYFPDKVRKGKRVVRAICILNHPITPGGEFSSQVIIPQKSVGRKNDIYVFCCSWQHHVAAQDKFLATVSTISETADPKSELKPGLSLLGDVEHCFFDEYDIMEPAADGKTDKCFISKSHDPSTHFETTSNDVLDLYHRITGHELDLTTQRVQQSDME